MKPAVLLGEISESEITRKLLNSGYEPRTYKGKEYYAIRKDFRASLSDSPLALNRANRVFVGKEVVVASPETASVEEFLDVLGCVDILVMMLVCQMLSCQQNNGTGFSISCVAAPACMSLRKKIASDLSRPFCGLTAPAPNGDCFRPNTGIGTVSINDSPVGLTKASGNRCFNISPATRTWNT